MQRNKQYEQYFTFTSRDGILLSWMSVLAQLYKQNKDEIKFKI